MRVFIKMSAALFVVTGILGIVGTAFFVGATINSEEFSVLNTMAMLFGAAGSTLIGGTAYMLCSIDERIEDAHRDPKAKGP